MRESRVDEVAPPGADAQRRCCTTCDVTWWGDAATECWCCGSPGQLASDTRRIVPDESAA